MTSLLWTHYSQTSTSLLLSIPQGLCICSTLCLEHFSWVLTWLVPFDMQISVHVYSVLRENLKCMFSSNHLEGVRAFCSHSRGEPILSYETRYNEREWIAQRGPRGVLYQTPLMFSLQIFAVSPVSKALGHLFYLGHFCGTNSTWILSSHHHGDPFTQTQPDSTSPHPCTTSLPPPLLQLACCYWSTRHCGSARCPHMHYPEMWGNSCAMGQNPDQWQTGIHHTKISHFLPCVELSWDAVIYMVSLRQTHGVAQCTSYPVLVPIPCLPASFSHAWYLGIVLPGKV